LETDRHGLVLVDAGFGLRDIAASQRRLSMFFRDLLRPSLDESETAIRQIERMGYRATDVRHVVLTHLDFDHAGGLDDFPHAHVHLLAKEHEVARAQRTWLDRRRFRPQQWSTESNWIPYAVGSGEKWFDFECVRAVRGLSEHVLLIPLPGHTRGHAGVAIAESPHGWLLHCGDAYFYREEIQEPPRCTPGLRAYQTLMEQNRAERLQNQARLRALVQAHDDSVRLFCAHDAKEFEAMKRAGPHRDDNATSPVPPAPSLHGR